MSKREEMRKRRQQETRQRTLIVAGIIAVIAIGVAGFFIYQSYENNRPVPAGSFVTVPTQTWPQADGKALGLATDKVVLQIFGDFQCSVCEEYFRSVEPQLMKDYVDTGKIRYEFHHFIVIDQNTGGTQSQHAAEASECANEQGHFWDYHNMLYTNQGAEGSDALADNRLKAFAAAIGLDTAKFNACFDSHRYASVVAADVALGESKGVSGTPTLFLNGTMVSNPLDYNALKQAIDLQLGAQ